MNFDQLLVKFRFVLSMVVPLCYIGMGFYVMIEQIFIVKIQPPVLAYCMGIVLVAYGIFRLYRAFKQQ
jgi:hypothetical protein